MEEEIQSIMMDTIIFNSPATANHPSMQEFPGEYKFQMEVGENEPTSKRSQTWQVQLIAQE